LEIGYWGLELGKAIAEREGLPICIVNGAVGGTRIDQHQRNTVDPTDVKTIYGRLLWRVQKAGLTHGVRGVFWHQGENDQGADGPTNRFGYETYEPFFVSLAAAWKEDYPNIEHYFAFQIWPKACATSIAQSVFEPQRHFYVGDKTSRRLSLSSRWIFSVCNDDSSTRPTKDLRKSADSNPDAT
jgi:hypothetical protein